MSKIRNFAFGQKIRLLRVQNNLSQTEFAVACGANPADRAKNLAAMVSGWERGDRELSLEMICRICRRFGVTSDWLIGLEPPIISGYTSEILDLLVANGQNLTEQDRRHALGILDVFITPERKCQYAENVG